MREGKFIGRITSYGIGQKEPKPPYVVIDFEFDDEGVTREIKYIGSLSDRAEHYTIDNLANIGYTGSLRSWDEIMAFNQMETDIQLDNITINIIEDEYQGKKKFKVNYFYGKKRELTDEEKHELCKKVFAYRNKDKSEAPAPAPAPKPKPKPKPKKQESVAESFDESEEIPF